jgi:hypothetical protein
MMMMFCFATSALKMEAVCFSETFALTKKSTRRQNPEEYHHHPHVVINPHDEES